MPRKATTGKKSNETVWKNPAVIVGIIGAVTTIIVAIIGLATPLVNRLAGEAIQNPPPTHIAELTMSLATPAFTLEPTATPSNLILVDDFSTNKDISVWSEAESFADIVDGVYRIGVLMPYKVFWSGYKFLEVSNFRARVDISMPISRNSYSCGIIFRSNNNGKYFFGINNDNRFEFVKYAYNAATNEVDAITIVDWEANMAVKSRGINTIEVVAERDTFEFLVNDVKVKTISDATHSNGLIGFYASTYGGGQEVTVEFDNFIVEER